MANLIRVMTKARKHLGRAIPSEPTKYQVECTGVSKFGYNGITVFSDQRDGTVKQGTSFVVGDIAEYGSYNLSYTGEITKITDKCVTIVAYKGHRGMEEAHRLDINEFCWRNHNFNAAETARQNAETSMYI
jgi:hypothetical protein